MARKPPFQKQCKSCCLRNGAKFVFPEIAQKSFYGCTCRETYFGQGSEEGDGLHGLAEAHLVRQDAIDALVVQAVQPVHALRGTRTEKSNPEDAPTSRPRYALQNNITGNTKQRANVKFLRF